jgi:hypothetical protein
LKIKDVDYEQLSPKSMQMLTAMREGRLAHFLLNHQQFIDTTN